MGLLDCVVNPGCRPATALASASAPMRWRRSTEYTLAATHTSATSARSVHVTHTAGQAQGAGYAG